jgi:hypothetical protein
MSLFRGRRPAPQEIEPSAIPVPRFSIDGWTLSGTPLATKLASKLARPDLRELETLLHGIAVEADTPYTYERAAVLLERSDEPGPALSVCEAWLRHPASKWPEYVHHTKAIDKHRARLRARLSNRQVAANG